MPKSIDLNGRTLIRIYSLEKAVYKFRKRERTRQTQKSSEKTYKTQKGIIMELKDLLGESYKEDMTIEDISAALADKSLVDPTTLPPSVDKATFDKTASDLAEAKKQLKAKQTDDERLVEEQRQRDTEFSNMQKELAKMKHEKSFVAAGYDEKTAASLTEHLVSGNMDEFVKVQSSYLSGAKEQIYASTKAELLSQAGGGMGGQSGGAGDDAEVTQARALAKARAESFKSAQESTNHYINQNTGGRS